MAKNQNIIKGIRLSSIDVKNNFNARQDFGDLEELANQIHENGLLEPISVVPYISKDGTERYFLVNGERRYRAMNLLEERGEGLDEVPARMIEVSDDTVDEGTLSDEEREERAKAVEANMYVQQYIRNASKQFTDYETALLFKKLYDAGKSKQEIAKLLGKNPGVVTYYLDIFNWDQRVQDMIAAGEIGIMNCHRVFKANKAKYGEESDYKAKATAELLRIHEKAVAKADEESGEKVKATLRDADLFGYVKETKAFVAGMRILKQYLGEYTQANPGLKVQINPIAFFERLKDDDSVTLKDLFDEAVRKAKESVA